VSKYVKFKYGRASDEIALFDEFAELNECRRKLLELQLIGVRSNGVTFGNVSVRDGVTNNFYVTGSATGASIIRIVDSRCGLQIGWLRACGYSLPRLELVADPSRSSSDNFKGR